MVADTCPQVAITILKNLNKNIQCYSIDLNKGGIDYLHFCQLALRTFEGGSPEVKKAEMDFIKVFLVFSMNFILQRCWWCGGHSLLLLFKSIG